MLFSSEEKEDIFLQTLTSMVGSLDAIQREFCGDSDECGLRKTIVACSVSLDKELDGIHTVLALIRKKMRSF